MTVWFWDVSNHQSTTPPLDAWDGLIAKASEGSNFQDGRFWQHINVARAAGKIHGGYHFLRSDAPIKDQVDTFTAVCPPDIAAVPDVEWIRDKTGRIISAPTLDQTREFVDRLLQKGYHVPMQYLPRWYWNFWGQPDLSGLPPLWGSYYPDYVARPRDLAWSMIPASAKQGFGGLPLVALQFTSSPLDQNRSELTPQQFYDFMSTTRRAPGGGGTITLQNGEDDMFFVGEIALNEDGSFGGWASNERFLVHGPWFTGGYTQEDIDNARADTRNGPIPLFGVPFDVLTDMRTKGDIPGKTLAALESVADKLSKISVGGIDTATLTADLAAGLNAVLPGAVVAEFKKEGN